MVRRANFRFTGSPDMASACCLAPRAAWVALSLGLAALGAAQPSPEVPAEDPAVWEFPAIRGAHRAWFRWSAELRSGRGNAAAEMQEAVTSGTLPMAMAAVVAAREAGTTVTVTLARAEALDERARTLTLDPPRRWGAQPLIRAFADHATALDMAPRELLRQFLPDDVRGNSMGAAEVYVVGLRHDPPRFEAPLAELALQPDAIEQERLMTDSLALLHAFGRTRAELWASASWYDMVSGVGEELEPASPESRRFARVARAVAMRNWSRGDVLGAQNIDSLVSRNSRRMSWWWIEGDADLRGEDFARMIASQEWMYGTDFSHIVACWALRDPASLADAKHEATLAHIMDRAPHIIVDMHFRAEQVRYRGDWGPGGIDNYLWRSSEEWHGGTLTFSATAMRRLRDSLYTVAESGKYPRAEINTAQLLAMVDGPGAIERLGPNLVLQLQDDNWSRNRWEVIEMFQELEDPGDIPAVLAAAIRQGVELDDPQLIRYSSQLLVEMGYPVADPAVLEYMSRQFRDDSREGNAANARRYLVACGEVARPYAEAMLESTDSQERHFGRMIIDDLNYIEYLR